MRITLFLTSLLFLLIPFELRTLYSKKLAQNHGTVAGIETNNSVTVGANIGSSVLSLFGYTSPKAVVTFEGMGVFEETSSNDEGYFEFDVRFSSSLTREACLSSKDQFGRVSSPACLPTFPTGDNVRVGPVIMPPTVSLDKKDYFIDDEVFLSGQAVPNTEIDLSVFGDVGTKTYFSLVKPVEAFTFPKLKVFSDDKGNFSINLPSSTSEKFRLFAQTNYKKFISSNSNKLNFEILPIWMIIIKFFLFLFSFIQPRLLEIAIVLEITYILYVLKSHFQEKTITLYRSRLPMIEKHNLPALEEKMALIKY